MALAFLIDHRHSRMPLQPLPLTALLLVGLAVALFVCRWALGRGIAALNRRLEASQSAESRSPPAAELLRHSASIAAAELINVADTRRNHASTLGQQVRLEAAKMRRSLAATPAAGRGTAASEAVGSTRINRGGQHRFFWSNRGG
jgi:hypothetical protein